MNLLDMLTALKAGENTDWSLIRPGKLEQVKVHPFFAPFLQQVRENADKATDTPIETVRYSWFKLHDEVGSRVEFQAAYFARRTMLTKYFLSALFFGEHISDLEDMLWTICDEYSWCLTAHFPYGGIHIPAALNEKEDGKGLVRSSFREQPEQVDLCNSTTACELAEIVALLEDKLAPAVVYRVRKEIRRRVLEPFMALNEPFWWEFTTNNWGAVCAGNIGVAAMYLIPQSVVLAPVLVRCYGTMECYLRGFLEDGACTEGLGYWEYGFSNFMLFADMLRRRTAGQLDFFQSEKVHRIALFQQNCFLNGKNVVCFSDCGDTGSYSYSTTHYLKSIYPDVTIPDVEKSAANSHMGLRDFLWTNPDFMPSGVPDGDVVFAESQWGITHVTLPGRKIAFAIKGGHNDESHNHNDIGSFVYDVDGEALLGDIGGGLYTREYFSDKRYTFLVNGSQGHPVPIVGGKYQQPGKERCAADFSYTYDEEKSVYRADLSPAYANEDLASLYRTVKLCKTCGNLTFTDEYAFAGDALPVTERFVTKFPVKAEGQDLLILGKKHTLRLHTEGGAWQVTQDGFVHGGGGSTEVLATTPVWLLDTVITDPTKPVVITATVV